MRVYGLDEFTLWREVLFVYKCNVVFVTILHLHIFIERSIYGKS